MLIRFLVSNFLSIGEKQELNMVSGKVRTKREHLAISKNMNLLRFSAIYGANAAGKSNLVKSLDFAKQTIVMGLPNDIYNKYNRTQENNINLPSHFEFEIQVNNKCYNYGFEVILNKNSFTSEWLYEVGKNKKKLIFNRNIADNYNELGTYFKKEMWINRLNIYLDDIKNEDTVLLLTEMNRNKTDLYKKKSEIEVFNLIFNWFRNQLEINYPENIFSNYSYFMSKSNSNEIIDKIKSFGFDITNFKIVNTKKEEWVNNLPEKLIKEITIKLEKEASISKKENGNVEDFTIFLRGNKEFYIFSMNENYEIYCETLVFEHGKHGIFQMSEESDGTLRILELIEILFSEGKNKIYVIDEIDRSLHPLLTKEFINTYLDSLDDKHIQLIVTTHESRLLDLELLRRDEIWFINKEVDGCSYLYSLEQFNERFDMRIENAYLNGRYNAIPKF